MQATMTDYTYLSLREFTHLLSSKQPVPGGGGGAAMCGALGIALGNMVMNLTIGKKKYARTEAEFLKLLRRSDVLMQKMYSFINEDAAAFEPLSKAYALPNNTPEEKARRSAIMEDALLGACRVPLDIMRTCADAISIIEIVAHKGNPMALSDAGAGAQLCMCAMEAASLNIYINAASMRNQETADSLAAQADSLIADNKQRAQRISSYVQERIRKKSV